MLSVQCCSTIAQTALLLRCPRASPALQCQSLSPRGLHLRLCISSWCLRPGPLTELWVLSNLHWTHNTANGAVAIFSHFMSVWPTNQVFILFYITLKKAIKKKQSSLITYPLLILALLIPHGYKQCITVNTSHCISMICNCLLS